MSNRKQTFITAFALFSLFFGAGNLILPPFLGYNSGSDWFWVLAGFTVSAVVIPIMAIYGHARLQGTMLDFGKKVSPIFALVYCAVVYAISSTLPSPRTASVTYEMAVEPYFNLSSLGLSAIYFAGVLIFVMNRSKILNIVGKFLTPLIIIILLLIIGIGFFGETQSLTDSIFTNSFTAGILEGYQTFDAIGGVVVGGVIVISLSLQGIGSYQVKKQIIARSGLLAGLGLFLIYGGLIAIGALYSGTFDIENRTELLNLLSQTTLGSMGTAFLGILVALACFTTAVGIVTGTADFVKGVAGESQLAYRITAVVACILGVVMGQFDVHYIIDIALPALMFIYPITIVLIFLNFIPERYSSALTFRLMVLVTFIFSIPDFIGFIFTENPLLLVREFMPLGEENMGWVLPAVLTFFIANSIKSSRA